MARKHVAPHAKRLQKQQERHRKAVWKVFKKLARHKGCYEAPKGGYMVFGAGFKGKNPKGGYMLYGAGVRKAGYKKKTIKLPKWVTKPIPKSGFPPKVPAGFSKKGGWLWSKHKKKASGETQRGNPAQLGSRSFPSVMLAPLRQIESQMQASLGNSIS